ncbi:hypothetical protein LLEC1_02383 [Akanthomyces lecanii]|uniref:Major facilitator superfamily (MFS) profile domain-containing protein n=1 Tax=Cordyceps confragosa TaxID=2714763 RepID=A0A179IHV8_CORDF|nr:hypothetical protein LLEC1_02383 [Akanthomyces lecanii]
MGSSTMASSEKNEVHVERVPNAVNDNAVLGKVLPAAGLPAEFAHLDEKKILRKMDMRLIPVLALLYLLSFLDRGNIGNANIEGLSDDLHLTPDQYNWCLTVFFFTYAAFEVPSNLMLKRLRPSRWLPTIMVAWGVVMTLMGIVRSYRGLLATRIFLGVAEAGLFPGVAVSFARPPHCPWMQSQLGKLTWCNAQKYYLTMWYCRHEIQLRQAMFFSAASVAGAFSGLLAFAISKMHGVGGLEGWRWIFILEGLVTVLVAILSYFLLYDFPETAGFLTEEERAFVVYRLRYQGQVASTTTTSSEAPTGTKVAQSEEFQWKYVWQAFADWQIYVNIFVYWGVVCPLYGISLFLPTIIKDLNYTNSTAQLMTVPIYITASILAVFGAFLSDRAGVRSPFIISLLCVMAAGFGIVGMALQIGIGNLGGAMASNFYRKKDKPRFILGHALELGFIGVGVVAAVLLLLSYRRINHKRDRQMREGADRLHTEEELAAMGDRAVTFRYMY